VKESIANKGKQEALIIGFDDEVGVKFDQSNPFSKKPKLGSSRSTNVTPNKQNSPT
jgi:hypothetical protein